MTESVSGVYDLTYPSPITLEQISSIVVVVELWREEICAQLKSKRLQEFDLKHNIQLKNVLPNLPSTIYRLLGKYVNSFRKSILQWRKYHRNVFNDSGSMNDLSRFDDFAWDWDGTIHEERTAKRMMMCDRLTQDEKFKIACLYCFEDDIRQIWPSVSETKDLNEIDFPTCPQQYYWICCLRNELHKIPIPYNESIDKFLISRIDGQGWRNRSAIMYFLNRLPSDSLTPVDIYLMFKSAAFFARFILPKLTEHQLDVFVAAKSVDLLSDLIRRPTHVHVLPTWMYIRSRMDISHFSRLIHALLLSESSVIFGKYCRSRRAEYLFREIWKSSPQHFKRSVLDDALYNDRLFTFRNSIEIYNSGGMKFLITVLRDATFEERNAFWHKNCRKLIFSAPFEDLVVMMKLCFQNENEITLFKENFTSIYENIAEGCTYSLRLGMFKEINNILYFCCPDVQKRRQLKQRLLRSNYVGENSIFTATVVSENKLLNEFIDDAFQDAADLCVEFRTQLASSPVTLNGLLNCIQYGFFDIDILPEFVNTFFPDEEFVVFLKKLLFEHFKNNLIAGDIQHIDGDNLEAFLVWLLGSEDEVIKFKRAIPAEDIFRTMIQAHLTRMPRYPENDFKPKFPERLGRFLMWYFNNDEEEIEEFTMLFLDELKSFRPRKCKRVV